VLAALGLLPLTQLSLNYTGIFKQNISTIADV
jgi:hypothetical protein